MPELLANPNFDPSPPPPPNFVEHILPGSPARIGSAAPGWDTQNNAHSNAYPPGVIMTTVVPNPAGGNMLWVSTSANGGAGVIASLTSDVSAGMIQHPGLGPDLSGPVKARIVVRIFVLSGYVQITVRGVIPVPPNADQPTRDEIRITSTHCVWEEIVINYDHFDYFIIFMQIGTTSQPPATPCQTGPTTFLLGACSIMPV